jgi:hypothetical protein
MSMSNNDVVAEAIRKTAPTYLEGRADATARQYEILNWLISHGRVLYNAKGYDLKWFTKVRRPKAHTVNGQRMEFNSVDTEEDYSVGFSKIRATDKIDEDTILTNDGPTAILKIAEKKIDDLLDSMGVELNSQFYNDDMVDPNGLTGIQSLFRGAVGAPTDKIAIAAPGATYGGRDMTLGSIGGSWSSNLAIADRFSSSLLNDYPDGDGTPDYDWNHPLMWNSHGDWGTGTNTWESNAEVILRRVALYTDSLNGRGAAPNVLLINKRMLAALRDKVSVRERLRPEDYSKGPSNVTTMEHYEGLDIIHDFNCPADRAYCVNANMMEMFVATKELFYLDGPKWDMKDEAYLMAFKMKGNLRWKPKHFSEIRKYV